MHVMLTVNAAWNILNFRQPIVNRLISDGCKVTVVAPEDESVPRLRQMGCDVLDLDMNVKGLSPLDDIRLIFEYRQIFKKHRPDVVLSYTIKNNIFGALAASTSSTPFIPNVTGLGTAFLSGGVLQSVAQGLYRKAFSKLPVVFFQNEDDRNLFIERKLISEAQSRLLPGSGIDLNYFSASPMPSASKPPVFLMIARLLKDKGVVEFVQAADIIKQKYPSVRFQLLGAIGAENRTAIDQRTVEQWVSTGLVEYLGTTKDVRQHIASASCVVLPSYREGAPRTLIEAAAMARPVITTDVPGCRSVVDRDVSGFLCQPKDAQSLADCIERFLLLDSNNQEKMGHAGRAKMQKQFDQSLVVDAYISAIEDVTMRSGNFDNGTLQ